MKKTLIILGMILSLTQLNAQAWQAKNFNIDIGYAIGSHGGAFYSPGVMVSLEKGIHKWVGVGAYTGFQYNLSGFTIWGGSFGTNHVAVPVGGFGSFHFYQMISDLVGKEIGSDKLDVAFKAGAGARFNFRSPVDVNFDFGASVMARYMFKENIGVYAEVGYPAMGNVVLGAAIKF